MDHKLDEFLANVLDPPRGLFLSFAISFPVE